MCYRDGQRGFECEDICELKRSQMRPLQHGVDGGIICCESTGVGFRMFLGGVYTYHGRSLHEAMQLRTGTGGGQVQESAPAVRWAVF